MNFAELTQFKTLSSNEPLITDFESMAMENRKAFCQHVNMSRLNLIGNMCHPELAKCTITPDQVSQHELS